ncbi:hypothetical protein VTK26DRAFT_8386 [Humicola hyalothermophila]
MTEERQVGLCQYPPRLNAGAPRSYATDIPRLDLFSPAILRVFSPLQRDRPELQHILARENQGPVEILFLGAHLDFSFCQSGHPVLRVAIWIKCGSSATRLFHSATRQIRQRNMGGNGKPAILMILDHHLVGRRSYDECLQDWYIRPASAPVNDVQHQLKESIIPVITSLLPSETPTPPHCQNTT